eukprot:817874-Pyramimonas_sp.AAC.1
MPSDSAGVTVWKYCAATRWTGCPPTHHAASVGQRVAERRGIFLSPDRRCWRLRALPPVWEAGGD